MYCIISTIAVAFEINIYLSIYISQTAIDTAIVTIKCE